MRNCEIILILRVLRSQLTPNNKAVVPKPGADIATNSCVKLVTSAEKDECVLTQNADVRRNHINAGDDVE
jgi:hypothetical protein